MIDLITAEQARSMVCRIPSDEIIERLNEAIVAAAKMGRYNVLFSVDDDNFDSTKNLLRDRGYDTSTIAYDDNTATIRIDW